SGRSARRWRRRTPPSGTVAAAGCAGAADACFRQGLPAGSAMALTLIRRRARRLGRLAGRIALLAVVAAAGLGLIFRWVNPPITWLMVTEWWRLGGIEREWVALEAMSPNLPLSAVAAEDANFCRHWGFDLDGIRAALADSSRLRGGSTISQQVAK